MTTVFDAKTGNMTILDRNGNPRVKMGNLNLGSLGGRYYQHTKHKPFKQPPKATGYTSLIGIHSDYTAINELPDIDNIFVYASEISDRIAGFGNINMEYILSNLKDYKYLLYKNYHSPNPYIKSLTQLLTINVYREYCNEPYNLPTTLNRSQIEQRYNLLEYLKQSAMSP